MIKSIDVKKLEDEIEAFFHKKITENIESLSFNGKALHFFKFEEFNQTVMDIITNNNKFIKNLYDMNLESPAPHIVFPERDFEALGSLQGEVELWWNVYWSPFWSSLTEEEKGKYLVRSELSSELSEFLILHS